MVNGIQSFVEQFRDFPDCYTIIGGTACDILMSDAGLDFRATRDIDMILILEDRFSGFAERFWNYIKAGGYRCGWKNNDAVHFYRFTEPQSAGYPKQIELFSRLPDYHLEVPNGIIPIHIDNQTSSLSAILLDDTYYNFMLKGRTIIDGLNVLQAAYLIPFKMYAWLNLIQQKAEGREVNDKDIRKHKYDVFRLLQIIPANARIDAGEAIRADIRAFLVAMEQQELPLQQLKIPMEQGTGIRMLHSIYLS